MSYYEEIEIEDLDYDPKKQLYTYPCPCGDKFAIGLDELHDGEDVALCPSCTLRILIIYDEDSLPPYEERSDDEESEEEDELHIEGDEANDSADEKGGAVKEGAEKVLEKLKDVKIEV